jgi:hypothetical protein
MSVGVALSVPWIIFDDGWRALCGTFPALAVLLASGFRTEMTPEAMGRTDRSPASALVAIAAVLGLSLVIPAVASRLDLIGSKAVMGIDLKPRQLWVLGGRAAASLLVIPDSEALPPNVPSLHYHDFKDAIDQSAIEFYEKLLYPGLETREFGFVASVGSVAGPILLTPPEVVRRQDVGAWRLTLDDSAPPAERYDRDPVSGTPLPPIQLPARYYFLFVGQAEPIEPGT